MVENIRDLLLSFDCDEGLPESIYNTTYRILKYFINETSAERFSSLISSTENKFYSKISGENLVEIVLNNLKNE
jgi:hypothetical protein